VIKHPSQSGCLIYEIEAVDLANFSDGSGEYRAGDYLVFAPVPTGVLVQIGGELVSTSSFDFASEFAQKFIEGTARIPRARRLELARSGVEKRTSSANDKEVDAAGSKEQAKRPLDSFFSSPHATPRMSPRD
jgi:hypothetical protein